MMQLVMVERIAEVMALGAMQSDETVNYFGNPQLHLVTLEGLLTRQDRTNQITYVGKESCQALNPNCVTN